jgi:hypothetical protein
MTQASPAKQDETDTDSSRQRLLSVAQAMNLTNVDTALQ